MTIVRVRPAHRASHLWNSLDQIIDAGRPARRQNQIEHPDWVPAVDLREDESHYIVEAEIPGIDKKDIHLSTKENVLTISGEKNVTNPSSKKSYCRERTYGSFRRDIQFGNEIVNDKIDAQYQHGVLTIMLPKSGQTRTKEIPVKFN